MRNEDVRYECCQPILGFGEGTVVSVCVEAKEGRECRCGGK